MFGWNLLFIPTKQKEKRTTTKIYYRQMNTQCKHYKIKSQQKERKKL